MSSEGYFSYSDGDKKHDVYLYGLSTCVWCKKVKRLLDQHEVAYNYVFMDTLDSDVKQTAREKLRKHNPDCSYPTLIIDDSKVIIGYSPADIEKALQL